MYHKKQERSQVIDALKDTGKEILDLLEHQTANNALAVSNTGDDLYMCMSTFYALTDHQKESIEWYDKIVHFPLLQ